MHVAHQAMRQPGPRLAAEPDDSGHKPGLISNDARKEKSLGGGLHLGNVGHEALGGTLVRPQKRRRRQWVDFARVLNLYPGSGSRPRVGVCGAARGRSQVVAHLRVLWNLTSPVDDTATPGGYVSGERSPPPTQRPTTRTQGREVVPAHRRPNRPTPANRDSTAPPDRPRYPV